MINAIGSYVGKNASAIAAALANAFVARVQADSGTVEESCLTTRIASLKSSGFYDKASLILLANGYKTNKLYSLLPTSGAGDFALTRAGGRKRQAATYLETLANGVPALDYTDSICPNLSLELARTNLHLQSQTFDNASWTKGATTVTANATAAPDNTLTSDALFETSATGTSHSLIQTVSKSVAALQYTISIYVKPNGRDWFKLNVDNAATGGWSTWFNVTTGVIGSNQQEGAAAFTFQNADITPAANGFYRCQMTFTTDATANLRFIFYGSADGITTGIYDGDITKGYYVWGSQLELGSYASSYITTTTAAIARVADAVTALTAISSLIGQTEGTLYFEGNSFADGTSKRISISDGTLNERVSIVFESDNKIYAYVVDGGVSVASIGALSFTTNTNYKIAVVYRANYAAIFINGVKVQEDVSVTVPACSQIRFDSGTGSAIMYGNVKAFAVSKTAISDSEAILLTT